MKKFSHIFKFIYESASKKRYVALVGLETGSVFNFILKDIYKRSYIPNIFLGKNCSLYELRILNRILSASLCRMLIYKLFLICVAS